ncbi:MAG: FGGY-family carbohydrate kinase [Clostridiales bacterium]|nr:FGGY-family carbohydrate kinase [Clostridiales bacterium]
MSNVLVIDVGSQSMRGIIFDDRGNLLIKEQVKYEPYKSKHNGFVEESADHYFDVMCQITRALRDKAPELLDSVIAMSVDTFRDTAVLLDENNTPIRDCILWSDQRKAAVNYKQLPLFTRFCLKLVGMDGAIKAIRKKIKTRWVQLNEPELWSKVHKVVHISVYLNYRLTGNLTDSYAATIGLQPFDYKKRKWHTKNALLFPVYEVPLDMMVPVCNPGDEIGTISEEIAQLSGLPVGLKVIASGSDKGCETLGNGCVGSNVASVSFGTASSIQFSTKKYFEPEPFMPAYPSVLKNYYNPETQIFRGYWMISWFKQNFAEIFVERAKQTGKSVEELMNEEIDNIPAGCDGLVLQPFWQAGLTTPEARGAIIGFSDFHSRAHMYRAIIEGIDFALREALERMERRGKQKIDYITISGGGSQSDIICQIAADIFGRPVKRAQTYETTGLGAAMVTFMSQGVFKDEQEAVDKMVRYTKTFTPNPATAKVYDDIFYNIYLKMYRKLRKFYKHLEK